MKYIVTVVVFLALAGGIWYVLGQSGMQMPSSETAPTTQTSDTSTTEPSQTFRGSVNELLARGGSWQCDVTFNVNGVSSEGTTYVSGGMLRGDFSSKVTPIGSVSTHLIVRDSTAYTWTSMMNRGFVFPIKDGEVQAGGNAEAAASFNQSYDFRCRAWSHDTSKFALPTDITF